jgi:hypothetical protein
MQGLLLRLSQLDADAENAVRVIGFFDRQITERVSLDSVVRNTAALAECPVGISSPGRGISLRAAPAADPTTCPLVPPGAMRQELEGGTVVWVARTGDPMPLDAILLERFAITVAVRLDNVSVPHPQLGDPALVELVLSRDPGVAERSRALRLLGLDPATELRVLAGTDVPATKCPTAKLGSVWAALHIGHVPGSVPTGGRLGVGPRVPAIEVARSWRGARRALRFATTSEPVVQWEQLGCLEVLADLDHTDLTQLVDLTALDQLAAEPQGGEMLLILDAFRTTGSARKAADATHHHHSTICARLKHAESVLKFQLDTPAGRFRLHLALVLHRLRADSDGRNRDDNTQA